MTALETLKQYFGYSEFRPGQTAIVEAILSGKDSLSLLPTGGGKSICFQVPGLMFGGIIVVISPLISLMKDQVDNLLKKGISATYICSGMNKNNLNIIFKNISLGAYSFVYVAPERLSSQSFQKCMSKTHVSLIVIDEAHCISEWGHDFRPQYLEIKAYIAHLARRPPIAALTATATRATMLDIIKQLALKDPKLNIGSTARTNLALVVFNCFNHSLQELVLLRLLVRHIGHSGIIYVTTRTKTTELVSLIGHYRVLLPDIPEVAAYHGGMTSEERARVQSAFMSDQIRVIVATNAFGMGVDKANIRFVIHYHMPASLEAYYQEVGRAGRDGQEAHCYLLHNPKNVEIHAGRVGTGARATHRKNKLKHMVSFVESAHCRTAMLSEYFQTSETSDLKSALQTHCVCDNCAGAIQKHPLLQAICAPEFQFLKSLYVWREQEAKINLCSSTQVMTSTALCFFALLKPESREAALIIPGIGDGWISLWWPSYQAYYATISPYDHQRFSHTVSANRSRSQQKMAA